MTAARAHPTLLSVKEWRALGEDDFHAEMQEGVPVVSPRPSKAHARILFRLCAQLDGQLPSGLEALPEVEVVVDSVTPATVRVPDVVVCATDSPEALQAEDVVLVVEVISPGSRRTDVVTKRSEYADAGIPHYWIVDPDAATLTTLDLSPHGYVEHVRRGRCVIEAPVPLTIDLDAALS
ncbi:MAG: Uma2 family endonuclease [Rhodococcus sp. (in: high G+C Gram-positive bacteria)]